MQAYKKMALRHHPDKVASEDREEAEGKFKLLGAAHAVLSDPDKRQKYDAGKDYTCIIYDMSEDFSRFLIDVSAASRRRYR